MQAQTSNKRRILHQCGIITIALLVASSHLVKLWATDGIYLSPDGGTYEKDQVVTITASAAPSYIYPYGEQCCGGGQNGTYEFFDIEYTGWYGDVVDPGGNGAGLDTSSTGSKSVTCNGLMRFRCSGGEDIAGPVSVNGSASFTVTDTPTPLAVTIDPPGKIDTFVGSAVELSCIPSGGKSPYTSMNWTCQNGNPATSSGQSTTVTWGQPGQYTVQIDVEDSSGPTKQSASATTTVNVYAIKHETVETAEENQDNERTSIGVGEFVNLSIVDDQDIPVGKGSFVVSGSSEGTVTNYNDGTGLLQASGNSGNLTLYAVIGGAQSPNVGLIKVAPNDIQAVPHTQPIKIRGTSYSKVYVDLELKLLPANVSYKNVVKIREFDTQSPANHPHTPGGQWLPISDFNMGVIDQVGSTVVKVDYAQDGWTWKCNWRWKSLDNEGDIKAGGYDQVFSWTPIKVNNLDTLNIKVTKFGYNQLDNSNEAVVNN